MSSPRVRPLGRPPAPRVTASPEFVIAGRALGKARLRELTGLRGALLTDLLNSRPFPASPAVVGALRRAAAVAGYAGPLLSPEAR